MATTIFTVELHAGFKLHVELNDRPVDFEIEFPNGKKIKFSRPKGDPGSVDATIKQDSTLDTHETPLAPGPSGKPRKRVRVKEQGGSASIEYVSDPDM
jgi:hypothetical protein